MKRRLGWGMLFVAGMAVGSAMTSYTRLPEVAAAATASAEESQSAEALNQLREMKTQLTEINGLLQSGTLQVVVAINPDAPR